MGGGGDGGGGALFGFEEAGDVFGGEFAAADAEEGSGELADHAVEESAGDGAEGPEVIAGEEFEGVEAADGVFAGVVADGGEGAEVVFAGEEGAGGADGVGVESGADVQAGEAEFGGHDGAVEEEIAVFLAENVEAGVEGFGDGTGSEDADVVREGAVEGADPLIAGEIGTGRVEMKGLAAGMDTGVGAAAGVDADFGIVGEAGKGGFDFALYGPLPRLNLPAAEGGAVVGGGQEEAGCGHVWGGVTVSFVPGCWRRWLRFRFEF